MLCAECIAGRQWRQFKHAVPAAVHAGVEETETTDFWSKKPVDDSVGLLASLRVGTQQLEDQ